MINIQPQNFTAPLRKGDEFLTIATSSAIADKTKLLEGIKILESWGLICLPQSVSERQWGYLAGPDETRFKELHQKSSAKLLVCARGGWGAARLLERDQPWRNGWLLGYSDITSLFLARLKAGFDGCLHGPLLSSLAQEPEWSKDRLKAILFGKSVPDLYGEPWISGIASGPLVVANLTVASHLLGTPHFPDLTGAILVLEDIGEPTYRIDRMLTQFRLAGLLKKIAGLGFGKFIECKSTENLSEESTFQLQEIIEDRTKDLDIPILWNLPIGHCVGNAALPLGRQVILNGEKGCLSLLSYSK